MRRDGKNQSIWQAFIPEYQTINPQNNKTHFDVIIVGGGITGLSTALLLQQGGKKCLLLEAENIGFGTSGGTTAHLNTLLETPYYMVEEDFGEIHAQRFADIARQAIQLVKNNVQQFNIDCDFKELPGYLFAEDENQAKELDKILSSYKKTGLEANEVNEIPLPIPYQKAAVFNQQAQIHATKYLYGIAQAFENIGGIIVQHCRVLKSSDSNKTKLVETNLGTFTANDVVYATHIPLQINLLHFRCAPYRSYAMAFKIKDGNYPEALVYDMQNPYHYYRTQKLNDEMYLIAGGEDHKTGHEPNTENRFRSLKAYINQYFDVEKIVYQWSSQYFETTDGLPYIGNLPGSNHAYVATGFAGNGITLGSASALVLSELILTGDSLYKETFDPRRVKPVAGFEDFVKENADVVKEFITKRINKESIESLSDLAPGEARVVKYEGESIAVYKDASGKIQALSPVCKHAKCYVVWNNSEHSWDCPCHGARYNVNGEVITAPAHEGLNKINITAEE